MSRSRVWGIALLLCLSIALAVTYLVVSKPNDYEHRLTEARRALREQRPESARGYAEAILRHDPENSDALMIAAFAAADVGDFETAVEFCQKVPTSAGTKFVDARCMLGNLQLNELRDLSAAEAAFRDALRVDENSLPALGGLAQALSLQTRTCELAAVQLRRIQNGVVSLPIVLSLAHSDLLYPDAELVDQFLKTEPDHPGLRLAKSRLALLHDDTVTAKSLLAEVIDATPNLAESQARMGEVLLAEGDASELAEWEESLPEETRTRPDVLMVLGKIAEQRSEEELAAQRFRAAGQLDPMSREAAFRLGQRLARMGRSQDAQAFLDHARVIEKYRKIFDHAPGQPVRLTAAQFQAAAEYAESLGLQAEAFALARIAIEQFNDRTWAPPLMNRAGFGLDPHSPQRMSSGENLFARLELPSIPEKESNSGFGRSEMPTADAVGSAPRFETIAGQSGLSFEFDNGVNRRISGAQRAYDFTGGGIAAFDFDADGWPDLFFSQGCRLDDRTGDPISGDTDQLFRNLAGRRFVSVSTSSLPADCDYSQGVAAGDLNNDGFQDLFVANLGRNRLLLNNGDGTFSDVTSSVSDHPKSWTTSCLICDLNGDGAADLYSVNYLSGDVISRVCRDESGRKASCVPQQFSAAQDQLHLSDGMGGYRNATAISGILRPDGKGLGIVAADLNGDSLTDLFVANDGVPNFLFMNRGEADSVLFEECGMQSGVAVNGRGLSEACMGIVANDFNGDDRIDLFVTNFMDESNTCYFSTPLPGFFDDRTAATGLGDPSLKVLGFGAQAVDGSLDGHLDLVIANGHVDDYSDVGIPYQMVPQFFDNLGGTRFQLVSPDIVGDFFREPRLGRALAKTDWDRDGAVDLVMGFLDSPYTLLQNRTNPRGHFITIVVHGSKIDRDAIGTLVSIRQGEQTWIHRQLTVGSGYQASNELSVFFGLGDNDSPVDVRVSWTKSVTQEFKAVPVDRRVVIIEGLGRAFTVPY